MRRLFPIWVHCIRDSFMDRLEGFGSILGAICVKSFCTNHLRVNHRLDDFASDHCRIIAFFGHVIISLQLSLT
jgi:hypothetical protein